MAAAEPPPPSVAGLILTNNDVIRSFFGNLPGELRSPQRFRRRAPCPIDFLEASGPPFPPLTAPRSGSSSLALISFSRVRSPERSEELKERLRKLAELAERREYQELVKDIAPKKEASESFSSYKDQIGFGMEFPVYLFETLDKTFQPAILMDIFASKNAAGGILGMISGQNTRVTSFLGSKTNCGADELVASQGASRSSSLFLTSEAMDMELLEEEAHEEAQEEAPKDEAEI
ncbi:hypothetical protein Cni_G21009 [Canna indica]|uniref:Uncharacterized protein n=1 Tax=Canna indica TaxID=4628 RepID=A0AAQ3KNN9_9LILI|nr:hypothetical protein Cni_G21009 [Canna indica]